MPLQPNFYEAELIDVVDDLMLHQHVRTPNRVRIGQNASLLDLLLTKFPDTLSDVRVLPPLAKSDHVLLYSKTWMRGRPSARAAPPLFKFNAVEEDVVRQYAGHFEWNSLSDLPTVSARWEVFKSWVNACTEATVPRRQQNKKRKNRPWVTKKIRRQLQLRDALWKGYRRNANDASLRVYNAQRNKCIHMQRRARISFETALVQKAASNPKEFFGHLQ